VALRRDLCAVVVDVDGGWGGDTVSRLKDNGIPVVGFKGAGRSNAKTRDRQLGFYNKRAEAWWRMREELDPGQDGGSMLALPPDASVKADPSRRRVGSLRHAASRSRTRTRFENGWAVRQTRATRS